MAARYLIVNADDLGLCASVNEGIFAAHEHGIVTSATLMVRRAAAADASRRAASLPDLSLGLHLDLAEWEYVGGEWIESYRRCDPDSAAAVEAECDAQLESFRSLVGRDPSHLDSHQHVHLSEPTATVAGRLADRLKVPLRGREVAFEGGFYGQDGKGAPYPDSISPAALVSLADSLPAGWSELGCHPARGSVPSTYDTERQVELGSLCDPYVRAALVERGFELRSFRDFARSAQGRRPLCDEHA